MIDVRAEDFVATIINSVTVTKGVWCNDGEEYEKVEAYWIKVRLGKLFPRQRPLCCVKNNVYSKNCVMTLKS